MLVAYILCFCLNWTKIILHSYLATDVLYVQELKRGEGGGPKVLYR